MNIKYYKNITFFIQITKFNIIIPSPSTSTSPKWYIPPFGCFLALEIISKFLLELYIHTLDDEVHIFFYNPTNVNTYNRCF